MIKRRDKKTGAITFIPTAEDKEKNKFHMRITELEKKVKYLENLIMNMNTIDSESSETNETTTKKKRKTKKTTDEDN